MHKVIADKREELTVLCQRYDVVRLEVFGSVVRGVDSDPATSDVDFLVKFSPDSNLRPFHRYFDLVEALQGVLGRSVNLLQMRAVINPYLHSEINKSRELVYAS